MTTLLSSSRRKLQLVPGLSSLHPELWHSPFGLALVVLDLLNPNFQCKELMYLVLFHNAPLVDINFATLVGCVLLLFSILCGKSHWHIAPVFFRILVSYTLIQNLPVALLPVAAPKRALPLFPLCHGSIQILVHRRFLVQVLS